MLIEPINPRASLLDRFNQSYMPVPESGCWLWIGGTGRRGYGRLCHENRQLSAHRFSYELHYGKAPGDLCVLHKCDTPACVNPLHLRLGTNADNMADRNAKGRTWGRLKPDDVRGIRALLRNGGMTRAAMGRIYGVSEATVCAIHANKVWRNVS